MVPSKWPQQWFHLSNAIEPEARQRALQSLTVARSRQFEMAATSQGPQKSFPLWCFVEMCTEIQGCLGSTLGLGGSCLVILCEHCKTAGGLELFQWNVGQL
jgi:hypothetical protein